MLVSNKLDIKKRIIEELIVQGSQNGCGITPLHGH